MHPPGFFGHQKKYAVDRNFGFESFLLLTEPIFKRCIVIFESLRKSLRVKTELKILPIFVFFSQIVVFFENSKNKKVQVLKVSTFRDNSVE